MATINISISDTDYEFYNVPLKVAKAVITILQECENDDSDICSAESEIENGLSRETL